MESDSRWSDLRPQPDDEISLFDLWLVLRKRWLAMLVIAGVIITLGATYAFIMPQTFHYTAALEIGQIPARDSVAPIESTDTVLTRMNAVLLPAEREDLRQSLGEAADSLGTEVEMSGRVLTISGEGPEQRADAYSTLMNGAMNSLIAIHQERLTAIREGLESGLDTIREQLSGFQSSQGGAWEAASALRLRAAELEGQLFALQPSHVLAEPRRSDDAVGTGKTVILALALVLGGMMAVFGAFVIEFVSRANAYARMQGDAEQHEQQRTR